MSDSGDRPGPIIVLRTDPDSGIQGILKTWPVPSDTGETLLVRRDGDDMSFLNNVGQLPDSSATLRVPLLRTEVLSVQATIDPTLQGKLIEGADYRGVPAVGVAVPVPCKTGC